MKLRKFNKLDSQALFNIGRKWLHKGIASEVFKGIISFLNERVEVRRTESRHDPRNPNSGKVMLKCGLHFL